MKVSNRKFFTFMLLGSMLISPMVLAEEIQSPVQEVVVDNSYLTKAHIQTNSKTEIQTITIKKSFLVWVTVRKGKDTAPASDNTK
ncbi:MAG: hypothetical protein IKY94_06660 [Lachnospiraceae bacterium]|nr:hypothetical protein [Clostridia bacterium]MBR4982222.1 hypothetical protein [Lachnospiraceae bacterium]